MPGAGGTEGAQRGQDAQARTGSAGSLHVYMQRLSQRHAFLPSCPPWLTILHGSEICGGWFYAVISPKSLCFHEAIGRCISSRYVDVDGSLFVYELARLSSVSDYTARRVAAVFLRARSATE
eukprot:5348752-Pleurochrysis_carterae.AAC.18